MVGPAALYIPKGFADAGLAGGLICVTVAMALFAFGMARLIASWRHARANGINTPGLDGVAYALAGTWAGHLATFCVTAMQCGVGVTYYIFVAENVDMLAPSRYNLTMGAVILAMAVLEAPLSLFKRLQRLHGLNAAGNLLVALALFTIFAVALERLDREGPAPSNYGVGPPGKVLTFAGTAVFAFEGTASIVVPVCDATARAHRGSLEYVVVGATAAVAFLCFVWHRLFFSIWAARRRHRGRVAAADVVARRAGALGVRPCGLGDVSPTAVPGQRFGVARAARVVECAAAARARRRAGSASVRVPAPPRPRRVAAGGPGLRAAGARRGAVGAFERRGDAAGAPARPGVHLRRVGDLRRGDGERAGDVAGRGVVIRFRFVYFVFIVCGGYSSYYRPSYSFIGS